MSTPLGSPSTSKFPSEQTTPRRSRKRTLDEIDKPATPRGQRKMEPLTDSTPPPGQASDHRSSPGIDSSRGTAQSSHCNGILDTDSSKPLQPGIGTETSTQAPEPSAPLEPYDWDDLERRFDHAMEERQGEEESIQQDFQKLAEMFTVWAQTPSTHVSERASKRLRTQRTFVNVAEEKLEQKRTHYVNVVKAFQTALDLLKEPSQRDADSTGDLHDLTSDLTARFKKLHSSGSTSGSASKPNLTQSTDEEEQSIEDLLAELGPEEQWTLHQDEKTNINALLEDARKALPPGPEKTQNDEEEQSKEIVENSSNEPRSESPTKPELHNFALDDEEEEDKNDDQQADEYLQKLLDEIANEPPDEEPSPTIETSKESSLSQRTAPTRTDTLQLPSTPFHITTSLLPNEDSTELSLPSAPSNALCLPSTPSSAPTSKKKIKGSKKEYDYTKEDMATWCTICNNDATVKCAGCEGDLYCARCWRETHTGFDERGHRWVKYSKR